MEKNKFSRAHHLIFEGPELVGKSFLMHGVYDFLESKYNQNKVILDGCHWFNSDVGIFGTKHGRFAVEQYVKIMTKLKSENLLFEKLHLSDAVYKKVHFNQTENYSKIEEQLKKLDAKIIMCAMKEDEDMIKKRIQNRLSLYPHYERILQDPNWYINQQREYLKQLKKSKLEHLIVDMTEIPNDNYKKVLAWISEI